MTLNRDRGKPNPSRHLEGVQMQSSDDSNSDVHHIRHMAELEVLTPADLDQLKIIHPGMRNKTALNTFRELRTKLVQEGGGENFVLLVSAVCPDGGASFVARNLAAAIALDKTKTALLIDCNLYDPVVHTEFGVNSHFDVGLTDYLVEDSINIDEIIYATGIERLRVIPVGNYSESGAEYFTSARMKKLITAVFQKYPDRYIILDAPAVNVWADSRILVELCSRALLVVPYGKVVEAQVNEAVETLGTSTPVDVVFNS